MEKIKLVEICNPKQWKTIPTGDLLDSGYPVYGANGVIGYYGEYNHENPVVTITCRGATCGSINITVPQAYVTGNAMCLDDVRDDIEIEYLYYCLKHYNFNGVISGSAQPQITRQGLNKVDISFCSHEKQLEIIHKLKKVEAVIKLREDEIDELDNLIKARFVEMFGDPVHNEKYNTRKLETCVKEKTDLVDGPFGSQVNTKVDYIDNGEIPVIRTVNVKMMSFSDIDLKFMTREKYESVKRSQVVPGDVILTKVGTIGNVCIFPKSYQEAVLSTTGSCRIRVDNNVVDTLFFAYNLIYLKGKLLEMASTGVQPFLNMKHVKNIDILDVPISMQKKFAEFVHQVDKSKIVV